MQILACDIGGTRTRVGLYDVSGDVPERHRLVEVLNRDFDNLAQVMQHCTRSLGTDSAPAAACLAVAGPVQGDSVSLTNLPWSIDTREASQALGIEHVYLINDFIAQGHAISALKATDCHVLQAGDAQAAGNRAVIGAGTGLGQAMLVPGDKHYLVYASEGGHVDFAPRDAQQIALLQYLLQELEQVSAEHLLSGPGLYRVYRFLRDTGVAREIPSLAEAMVEGDAAAIISQHAEDDPLCRKTMQLFCRIYGAHAANVGLSCLATGGVYLTGGVTRRIMQYLAEGELVTAFRQHASMPGLLEQMPLLAVNDDNPGLLGAAMYAARRLQD